MLNLKNKKPKTKEEFTKVLLENRGIEGLKNIDPLDLTCKDFGVKEKDLKNFIKIIKEYKGKNIVIYGDYDADGFGATAVLWLTLQELGIEAIPFIPSRMKHGYGLNERAFSDLKELEPDLIITVDNGVAAGTAIKKLEEDGIKVIVSDHHQKQDVPNCPLIWTDKTCGAGVAWLIAKYMLKDEEFIRALLDIVTISVIGDVMPVLGVNRSIILEGMRIMKSSPRRGIAALLRDFKIKDLTSKDIAFSLSPAINAVGRMTGGIEPLKLLCTNSQILSDKLSKELLEINDQRKNLTKELVKEYGEISNPSNIIVVEGDIHGGLLGILANKIAERYNRPTIVVNNTGDIYKGSARSIEGVNITDRILNSPRVLTAGGHEQATGFSVKKEDFEFFTYDLLSECDFEIKEPVFEAECEVDISLCDDLLEVIQEFEPFGPDNPRPKVLITGRFGKHFYMGAEKKHVKFTVIQDDWAIDCIAWNYEGEVFTNQEVQVLGELQRDSYSKKTVLVVDNIFCLG